MTIMPEISQRADGLQSLAFTSDADFDDGTLDNISIEGTGAGAKLRLSLIDMNNWTNMNPSNKPPGRVSAVMAEVFGTDKVVIFGGNTNDGMEGFTNETWVYDYSDNNWTQMFPPISPVKRNSHGLTTIYGDDKVLLFGGWAGDTPKRLNDTWVYDLSENTWTERHPLQSPAGRDNHGQSAIYNDDKALIFSGDIGPPFAGSSDNETWIYDLSENTWTKQHPSTIPPSNDNFRMAQISGTDRILMFGGWYGGNTTWIYDVGDDEWTKLDLPVNPPWRYSHAMASVNNDDRVIMMNGCNGSSQVNDLWIYDLSENNWTQKFPVSKPKIGGDYGMAMLYNDDITILFGGWDGINWFQKYDETWVYNAASFAPEGTLISKEFNLGSPAAFKTLYWNSWGIA